MFFSNLSRLWFHIDPKHKRQVISLLLLNVLSSLGEAASVGAVLPFLSALFSPETLMKNEYVAPVIALSGVTNHLDLALAFTLLFISIVVASSILRFLTLWLQLKLGFEIGSNISYSIYKSALYQPYSVHIS